MHKFSVSYARYTDSSVEAGDADCRGFIIEGVTLRHALEYLTDQAGECAYASDGYVNADSGPQPRRVRWLEVNYPNPYPDEPEVISEARYLHIPETVSDASTLRILRLIERL